MGTAKVFLTQNTRSAVGTRRPEKTMGNENSSSYYSSTRDRAQGTQVAVAEARRQTEGKYNIVCIKAGHNYDISGILPYMYKSQEINLCGYKYMVYIFVKGTFVNNGDGGFINWAFWGNANRDGGRVTFTPF